MDSTTTGPAATVAEAGAARTPGRERLLIGGAVALTTAITAAVIGFAIGGSSPGYDESAHRAAIEAVSDLPVGDWNSYLDVAKKTCAMSPTDLSMMVTVVGETRPSSFALMRVDFQRLCPERSDELESKISADQFRRAMGGTS